MMPMPTVWAPAPVSRVSLGVTDPLRTWVSDGDGVDELAA